jgi:hypothetical protein
MAERKVIRIMAKQMRAGDALVIQKGTIRTYYHICELGIDKLGVEIVYNDSKQKGGVGRKGFRRTERVRVRRTYR